MKRQYINGNMFCNFLYNSARKISMNFILVLNIMQEEMEILYVCCLLKSDVRQTVDSQKWVFVIGKCLISIRTRINRVHEMYPVVVHASKFALICVYVKLLIYSVALNDFGRNGQMFIQTQRENAQILYINTIPLQHLIYHSIQLESWLCSGRCAWFVWIVCYG